MDAELAAAVALPLCGAAVLAPSAAVDGGNVCGAVAACAVVWARAADTAPGASNTIAAAASARKGP